MTENNADRIRHQLAVIVDNTCYQTLTGNLIKGVCHPTCSQVNQEEKVLPPCQTGEKLKNTRKKLNAAFPNSSDEADRLLDEYKTRAY